MLFENYAKYVLGEKQGEKLKGAMPMTTRIGFAGYIAPCHSAGYRAVRLIEGSCREDQISIEVTIRQSDI
jgi:hypothetical protein